MLQIETGIVVPITTRISKGDSRLNAIKDTLAAMTIKHQSFLLPMESYEKAQEERRHYVNRANAYGKANGKEFGIAAVDGQPAIAAKGDKPAVAATKPGLRFWLLNQPEIKEVVATDGENGPEGDVIVP